MRQRLISVMLVIALTLSMFLPVHAQASAPAVAQSQASLQGEIAYMLNGDIWLLDLVTGKSQQLTKDGDNRWPTWSSDGRYLLYTHGKGEDASDLYILEVGKSAPKLLVKDACCASWEKPDGNRIAYVALAEPALAIEALRADGAGKETLFAPLQYGRSTWPTGNMVWVKDKRSEEILIPLEVIENSAQTGLTTYQNIFTVNLPKATLDSPKGRSGCFIRKLDFIIKTDSSSQILPADFIALEFEGNNCYEKMDYGKGIGVDSPDRSHILPWLAYPSWSPDGNYLAAERYKEAADPVNAELIGLVLYDVRNDKQQEVVKGGAQPAWRSAPSIDPVVMPYIQPGERVVTIEPALTWQDATYRVHVLTTGDSKLITPALFTAPNADALTKRGITALIVTKDGKVINDAATLRQIFLLYTSAYLLYEQPPTEFDPKIGDELSKVLDNPIFQAVAVSELWKTRRAQTTEALRTLLTDQVSTKTTLDPLLEQAFATTPKQDAG